MICPFCGNEMTAGSVAGDGRQKVVWNTPGVKRSFTDALVGKGMIENVSYSLSRFEIKADYCPRCEKIILDARVRK